MKVCVINSIFSPYTRGGAEVVSETIAREFAEAGHNVFVLTCGPFEGWRSFAGKWDVSNFSERKIETSLFSLRVFRFTPLNLFTIFNISKYPLFLRILWHILDMFNLHTYFVVRRILREEKPGLIITRNLKGLGYTIPAAIRNWKLEIRNSTKWVHGLHDLGALHPRGYMEWGKENVIRKPMPLIRAYRAICRKLFGSPNAIIAPSQFVLDEYERAGFFPKSRMVVIYNPIDHNPSHPPLILRGGELESPPLKIRGDRGVMFRFVYAGQLESYKGIRVLLDAWRKFSAQYPKAVLEIAGQGTLVEEVKRAERLLPGIRYRGFISHNELAEFYARASAVIVPSLAYETFGLAAAEGLCCGAPVIASRLGGLVEFIQDGVNGFLVAPGSAQELCLAMEKIIKGDPETMKKNALKSAKQFFTQSYICAILGKL